MALNDLEGEIEKLRAKTQDINQKVELLENERQRNNRAPDVISMQFGHRAENAAQQQQQQQQQQQSKPSLAKTAAANQSIKLVPDDVDTNAALKVAKRNSLTVATADGSGSAHAAQQAARDGAGDAPLSFFSDKAPNASGARNLITPVADRRSVVRFNLYFHSTCFLSFF